MVRFTLFEINLDGSEFKASAPFSGSGAGEATAEAGASKQERLEREGKSEGSGASLLALVAGLVALGGGVAVARKLLARRRSDATGSEAKSRILAK